MLIKKSNSIKKENSKQCTVWEYDLPSQNVSFAIAKINGRFPDNGSAQNTKCEEIYYVISGTGTIHTTKGDFEIAEGDLYHFEIGETYNVEGKELVIALINAPKWYIEQFKLQP